MGPIALFDKSFLQQLTLDESVWFDHFFVTNICPLFYVETLADLKKTVRQGRTPEQEVRIIADKFPEMHGTPNVQHVDTCTGELLGHQAPMTGQILIAGGRPVKTGEESGWIFEQSPEAEAFSRWQKGEFYDVERLYAHGWRDAVTSLDLEKMAKCFRNLGIDGKKCNSLEQAKAIADEMVSSSEKPFEKMRLALLFLNIHPQYHQKILHRWSLRSYPPLKRYAPYVAYVFTVELFFQIALAAKLISSERPSNRVDIGYLFYLPFSMMFVSSDKLHRRCAPLFLRKNQQFVWGPDLKSDLKKINKHYLKYPNEEKEKGVISFAGNPPEEGDFLIKDIWDFHFPNWRNKNERKVTGKNINHDDLLERLKKLADAPTIPSDEIDVSTSDTDSVTMKRMMRKKKGSWFQVPKDLKQTED